ncbi:MAG TPA: D-cysteine desulfhydrase family protein [Bacteroidetes bacterium]|nr:D-cysteine desulfhydrase family protein [Bacteroidota bacterium]
MTFTIPPRLHLACLPTPIQKLERLSQYLDGPTIYMKRDDLTGLGLSGNKIRKLEFVIQEALQQKCDTLITTGGLGSNHARATAVAARQLGLHPYLVLRGKPDPAPDGNFLLDALLNAEIKLISREEYRHRDEIMQEVAEQLKDQGKKSYIIPEGASNEIGAWGYFEAAGEIKEQIGKGGYRKFDAILLPVGSGGTQAGLLLGAEYYGLDIPVYGINVCDDEAYFVARINQIIDAFAERYAYPKELPKDKIQIIDGYVGEGYALSREEELEVIKLVAGLEGIFLDPVYTGKTMHGLIEQIKKGQFTKGMNLLFIHTGGIFGLFPKRQIFMGGPDSGEFYQG